MEPVGGSDAGHEQGCDVGPLPGNEPLDIGGAAPQQSASRQGRSEQPGLAARAAQGGHHAPEQQQVAQRAGADDERPQGTSIRAVATLPSRSVARTITMCGPGGDNLGENS